MSGHESSPSLEAQLELLKTIITDFNASRYTSGTSSPRLRHVLTVFILNVSGWLRCVTF